MTQTLTDRLVWQTKPFPLSSLLSGVANDQEITSLVSLSTDTGQPRRKVRHTCQVWKRTNCHHSIRRAKFEPYSNSHAKINRSRSMGRIFFRHENEPHHDTKALPLASSSIQHRSLATPLMKVRFASSVFGTHPRCENSS